MRIIGAVALLCAGWAVGFFSGRMSAWLFPVTDTQIVVMQKAPEPAAPAPTAAEKGSPAPEAAAATPAPAQPAGPPEASSTVAAREEATAPSSPTPPAAKDGGERPAQPAESVAPTAGQADTAQTKITVINPDAGKRAPPTAREPVRSREDREHLTREPASQPDDYAPAYGYRSPDQASIAACERRYSSFRRSDGTYQPYNSPTRELCPLLR